ncbi:MAG: hypothetical protein E6R03_17585 [Hyphomicrobiaceae bacterium]|nr:MAG: hypothetical protein E6R03_17585 [Hyphomicrobiaceae bacterium]
MIRKRLKDYENCHWWQQEKGDAHGSLFSLLTKQKDRIARRNRQWHYLEYLYYTGREPDAAEFVFDDFGARWRDRLEERRILNNIQNTTDSAISLVVSLTPKVLFSAADGSDYLNKIKAKRMTRFVEGVKEDNRLKFKSVALTQFAAIGGDGFTYSYFNPDLKRCEIEIVHPTEIFVDERVAGYRGGDPYTIYRLVYLPVENVLAQYGTDKKMRQAICDSATPASSLDFGVQTSYDEDTDVVLVVSAWRRSHGKYDEDGGRHIVCVENATLIDTPWKHSFFPISHFAWSRTTHSYFGQGVVEKIVDAQLEFNGHYQAISDQLRLNNGIAQYTDGDLKDPDDLKNLRPGTIIRKTAGGQGLEWIPPPPISPDRINMMWELWRNMPQIVSVSHLTAFGASPSDRSSYESRQLGVKVEARRFTGEGRNWEEFHVDLSNVILSLSGEYFRAHPNVPLYYKPAMSAGKKVSWDYLAVPADVPLSYRSYTTDYLASTPAGQMGLLEQLLGIVQLKPEEIMGVLDYPDLQELFSEATAGSNLIKLQIAEMIDEQIPHFPHASQDLQACIMKGEAALHDSLANGNSPDNLIFLQNYINQAKSDLAEQQSLAMAQMAQQQAGAAPGATEQSQQLPLPGV